LIVTIHEGVGFSIPDKYLPDRYKNQRKDLTNNRHGQLPSRCLPYALLDFDKSQVLINSVSGTL
jgi:hypothetical protein